MEGRPANTPGPEQSPTTWLARLQILASSEDEDEPAPCSAGYRRLSAEKRQPCPLAAAGAAPGPRLPPMVAPRIIRKLRKPAGKGAGDVLDAEKGAALPVVSTPVATAPNRISGKRAAPAEEQLFAVAAAACQPTATAVGPCAAGGADVDRRRGSETVSSKRALLLRGAAGGSTAPMFVAGSHEGHGESHTPLKARRAATAAAAPPAAPEGAAAATAAAATTKRGRKKAVGGGPTVCTRSSRRGRS